VLIHFTRNDRGRFARLFIISSARGAHERKRASSLRRKAKQRLCSAVQEKKKKNK